LREDRLRLERLQDIKAEYVELDKTLSSILEKRKHSVMVPLGEKAFVRGHLTHTNEVTVAIGDNYFVKCSVKHAKGIIARRVELVDNNIKQFKAEFDFLLSQLGMTAEVLDIKEKDPDEDIIEIREEYHSDEELKLQTQPNPGKKPKIEVIASTEEEDDPFMKVIDHFATLEMEEEKMTQSKTNIDEPKTEESKKKIEDIDATLHGQKRKSEFIQKAEDTKRQHVNPPQNKQEEITKSQIKPGEPFYAPPQEKKKPPARQQQLQKKPLSGEPFYAPPRDNKQDAVSTIPPVQTQRHQQKRVLDPIVTQPVERDVIQAFNFSEDAERKKKKETSSQEPNITPLERDTNNYFRSDLLNFNQNDIVPQQQPQKVSKFKAQQQSLKQQRDNK